MSCVQCPSVIERAYPDLNQGPADLQSAALTTELYTHVSTIEVFLFTHKIASPQQEAANLAKSNGGLQAGQGDEVRRMISRSSPDP